MKILVSGGAGFIGSHVVDTLIENGHELIVVDNLSSGRKENVNPKAKIYPYDLGDHRSIAEIFKKELPEAVYHLAAHMNLRKSVETPIFDAQENIINTLNLLDCCVKFGVKKIIFSSTGGAIYGDTSEIPTSENYKARPTSPYGCAKLSVETYLHHYQQVHGLRYTILRYSNVYGPRQISGGETGIISIFFENLFANKQSVIFGGKQKRDFVYVGDVARSNLLALSDERNEIYNIGTGEETDIISLFSKVSSFFADKINPEFSSIKKGEQMRSCLSFKKISEHSGWKPEVSLDEGIAKTYDWYCSLQNI